MSSRTNVNQEVACPLCSTAPAHLARVLDDGSISCAWCNEIVKPDEALRRIESNCIQYLLGNAWALQGSDRQRNAVRVLFGRLVGGKPFDAIEARRVVHAVNAAGRNPLPRLTVECLVRDESERLLARLEQS